MGMFPVRGGILVDGVASVGSGVMNGRGVLVFTVLLLQVTAVGARLKGRGDRFAKRDSCLLHQASACSSGPVVPLFPPRCSPAAQSGKFAKKPLYALGSLATCPACVIGRTQDHVISTEINAKPRTKSV